MIKPRNEPVTPGDRELVSDVAAGAGLLLRNVALHRQLEERAREVRQSRLRLVAAQDNERHRLERDLHDGAQQQVVALKVKLGLAETLASRAGADDVATLVAGLAADTQNAVEALRTVAHGIYPPLLEAEGLDVALRAVERTATQPLVIENQGLTRYERHVEETVYFWVLEGIERAHMAGASSVHVNLTTATEEVLLDIDHDGNITEADLTALTDRIDAHGGATVLEVGADGLPASPAGYRPATQWWRRCERRVEPAQVPPETSPPRHQHHHREHRDLCIAGGIHCRGLHRSGCRGQHPRGRGVRFWSSDRGIGADCDGVSAGSETSGAVGEPVRIRRAGDSL